MVMTIVIGEISKDKDKSERVHIMINNEISKCCDLFTHCGDDDCDRWRKDKDKDKSERVYIMINNEISKCCDLFTHCGDDDGDRRNK